MPGKSPVTVAIADNHNITRHAIKLELKEKEEVTLLWEAETGRELLQRMDAGKPDVLLLNLGIRGVHDMRAITLLRHAYNPIRIVILTLHNDKAFISDIMDAGANACLLRATHPREIYRAIAACRQSGFYFDNLLEKIGMSVREVQRIYRKAVNLSEKELLLLQLLAEDKLTTEISKELRLSARRVEALRQDMKAKIGAKTIAGLIASGVRNKLID
jgi:DNA-binding NarL/FixJ family response regulator